MKYHGSSRTVSNWQEDWEQMTDSQRYYGIFLNLGHHIPLYSLLILFTLLIILTTTKALILKIKTLKKKIISTQIYLKMPIPASTAPSVSIYFLVQKLSFLKSRGLLFSSLHPSFIGSYPSITRPGLLLPVLYYYCSIDQVSFSFLWDLLMHLGVSGH